MMSQLKRFFFLFDILFKAQILAFATPSSLRTCAVGTCSSESSMTRLQMTKSTVTFIDALSKAASESLGRTVTLEHARGGGASGGGGASTSAVVDKATGQKYFVKSASGEQSQKMLRAEYLGIKEMAETKTIHVPSPIAYGTTEGGGSQSFVIFEYLELSGGGSQFELGQNLAKMHRHYSPNGKFGFHVDNTIGATFQPNLPWIDDWAEFWDKHRLGHMLKLSDNVGFDNAKIEKLRQKTRETLTHNPAPSLLHGDLWGGNKGFCKIDDRIVPCIFDPATYYGDREADVAMTYVFGGFSNDFYEGYNSEWPLPKGHEQRRTIYNLYHILNHYVLFGGSYLSQAKSMIEQILRS